MTLPEAQRQPRRDRRFFGAENRYITKMIACNLRQTHSSLI